MRKTLIAAVRDAILVECELPHQERCINKSCLSSSKDFCFKNEKPDEVSKIIYNGIVEFAINEYDIHYDDLKLEQRKVITSRLRYNSSADSSTKMKYGFYGEVLLDLLLRVFLKTRVLVARGYFYSPIENSEPKGFDAFHLMENKGNIDLWFGEAKFYINYKAAITAVLSKLRTSLSDDYLNKNLLAIINERENISVNNPQLNNLLDAWEKNPSINLAKEIQKRKIKLIYPIFIAYQKIPTDDYYQSIEQCVDYISEECARLDISVSATFTYRLFFMFLPLIAVKKIKETVITWIESQEPLI